MRMELELKRMAAPKLLALMTGFLGVIAAPVAMAACSGPHCDPNWAFQNQINAQRAQEQQMMEAHQRQMDMYYGGQSSSSGSAGASFSPPPRYTPPPPPKGWQSRFTGFVSFKTGEDEDRRDRGFRYDYALAMNYPTEAEARAAATEMCRDRVLRSWESYDIDDHCASQTYVYKDAFITLVTHSNGDLGLYEQPTRDLAINQHGRGVMIGDRIFYCADLSNPSPDRCQSTLFGFGQNGSHRDRGNPQDFRIFPCPEGSPDRRYKVVGVDRLSGTDVPVCGPDPTAFALEDRKDRWDAYATHPRYVLPFAAGGFTDLAVAQKAVLAMCNRFTGGGCIAAGEHQNGVSVWVRNEEGQLFLGKGSDEASALADGRSKCAPGQILSCKKVITRLAGDLRVYGPNYKPSDYRYFGAVALPGGKVGVDRSAWIAQNMDTQADADRYALQACQNSNSGNIPCKIVGRGLGTRFFGYSSLDGERGMFTLLEQGGNTLIDTDDRRTAMLKAICAPRNKLCKTQGAIQASDDGEGREPNVTTLRFPLE